MTATQRMKSSASDWEFASLPNMEVAGMKIAVGASFFSIRSRSMKSSAIAIFAGYGLGFSLITRRAKALGNRPQLALPLRYNRVQSLYSWSLSDLDGAGGRLSSASGALSKGYGVSCITAFTRSGTLFQSQDIHGPIVSGFGVGLSVLAGRWTVVNA